ncbi:MAG: ribonuclease III [Clostridia bacterium]|nr:ribonuclease III [Clostridia bacterium]
MYAPVTLAYIGDAVYETMVREHLIHEKSLPSHILSRRAKRFVSAAAQSEIYDRLAPSLTEDEADIFRRGRNSKPATVPKNTDVIVYKKATGFEAVFGYLYITGRFERIRELFLKILEMEL